jgi:hypothetical protein
LLLILYPCQLPLQASSAWNIISQSSMSMSDCKHTHTHTHTQTQLYLFTPSGIHRSISTGYPPTNSAIALCTSRYSAFYLPESIKQERGSVKCNNILYSYVIVIRC